MVEIVETLSLAGLKPGQQGLVISLTANGLTRRRMLDLGLVPGTLVESLRRSPAGDPTAYRIRGAVIALRAEEGNQIVIKPV